MTIDPCGPDCQLCAADQARREAYLAKHRKYNASSKGQRRNRRYEDRNPGRRLRWEPARNALRSPMHNGADLPPEPPASITETTEGVLTQ